MEINAPESLDPNKMAQPDPNKLARPVKLPLYCLYASFLLFFLWCATFFLPRLPLPAVIPITLLAALPIAITHAYYRVISRTRSSHTYAAGGLVVKIAGRRHLANFFYLAAGVLASFFMLIYLTTQDSAFWLCTALAVPGFLIVHKAAAAFWRRESVPWLRPARAARWATWLTPLLMLALYGLILHLSGGITVYASLAEAKAAQLSPLAGSDSAFIREYAQWSALLAGYNDYMMGYVRQASYEIGLLVWLVSYFAIFWNISSWMAFCCLPGRELSRILLPLLPYEKLPKVSPRIIYGYLLLGPVLILLIGLNGVPWLEKQARWTADGSSDTVWAEYRRDLEERLDQFVALVEGTFYSGEIFKENEFLQRAAESAKERLKKDLTAEHQRIFSGYEKNIDAYLDWYYSLSGEYTRLSNLILGELETYMAEQFEAHLTEGVDTVGLNQALSEYSDEVAEIQQEWLKLPEKHRLDESETEWKRVRNMANNEFWAALPPPLELRTPTELLNFRTRLGLSAAGGLAAGGTAGVIAAKMTQKIIFKTAAKILLKAAASKGATLAGSAALGAGAGTVALPGAGTVVGLAAGVVAWGAVTLFADKTLLVLEETVNREEFKAEIMAAIEEQRRLILATIQRI